MAAFRIFMCGLGLLAVFGSSRVQAYMSPEPLPAGVRALAYVYGFGAGVDSRINDEGHLELLAKPLNRSVTLSDLAEQEPELLRLQSFLKGMDPVWADNLIGANLYSNISVFESRKVSGFMYGFSNRLAVGFILPWIEREMSFDFRAEVTNNAGAVAAGVGDNQELQDGLKKLEEYPLNSETFIKSVIVDRGYEAPASQSYQAWGDLELETRYTYHLEGRWGLGIRSAIVAPTSSYKRNIRNVLDQDIAEQAWAVRLQHLAEYQILPRRIYWSAAFGGKLRAPKKQERAYALSSADLLPDLTDPYQIETVSKTFGPEFNAVTGLQVSFFQGLFNVMGSYFYSVKAADSISGVRGLDYARETRGTDSQTQGFEAAVEFSTFSAFQRDSFFIPLKVSAAYVRPTAGRNAIYAPYWRFDSVLLF